MLDNTQGSLQNNANITVSSSVSAETNESPAAMVDEIVLPEQFFSGAAESASRWSGERRLLFAVLQDAVESFLRHQHATSRRSKRLFGEDKEWFWTKDCYDLFSFESICVHLSLDPDYIRMGLKRALQVHANPLAQPQRTASRVEQHLSLIPVAAEEKGVYGGMPRETLEQLMHEIAA
jgi:hypothetical protein